MASYKRVVLTETENAVTESAAFNQAPAKTTLRKQLDKFDNSYTSKKLNELYNEFDAITFNSPSLSATTTAEVAAYMQQNTANSFRAKVYLASSILVRWLFAFLAIYNIFVINRLNAGITL